jgi:hypothetical protein
MKSARPGPLKNVIAATPAPAMIPIILSLVAALIARYLCAVAARSPQ